MIDVNEEKPRSFSEISRVHPIHPSVATLWRWALNGVKGHRLESFLYGGRRYTTTEAIDRFAARLTELRSPEGPNVSVRRQQDMARAAESAEAIYESRTRLPPRPKTEESSRRSGVKRRSGSTN